MPSPRRPTKRADDKAVGADCCTSRGASDSPAAEACCNSEMRTTPFESALRTGRRPAVLLCALVASVMCAQGAPATGRVVTASDNLQDILNRARPGDTIQLAPGATFTGNFVLPAKSGDAIITIRSAAADGSLPARGTRVTPEHSRLLPKLVTNNSGPALQVASGAHHYRLQYIEFVAAAGGATDTLINIGHGDQQQSRAEDVPHDLSFEHILIDVPPRTPLKRGIGLNSRATTVVDSYIAGIKAAGQETQAIAGWNGPGEYLIENNYIEAAGINVMFGGADPDIPDLVPTGIVFRRNHFTKRWSWWRRHETYDGSAWDVKNLFELKNARQVTIVGNNFDNNWVGAQAGWAIVLTPRSGGRAPWSTVQDIEFRDNVVAHSANGVNILGWSEYAPAQQAKNIHIVNNLFYDLASAYGRGSGRFLQLIDAPADVLVEHNTIDHTGNVITFDKRPATGFVYRYNVSKHNTYGVVGSGVEGGLGTLRRFAPGFVFVGNVLAGANPKKYPPDNFFPAADAFDRDFVDKASADYRLVDNSPFRAKAADKSDLGANVDKLAPRPAK